MNFDDNFTALENKITNLLFQKQKDRLEPFDMLVFACRLYWKHKNDQENIIDQFTSTFINCLYPIMMNKYDFYEMERYIEEFEWELRDFKEDNIDATDLDCINHQITIHESILNKTFQYLVDLGGGRSLEIISLIDIDFLEQFKFSSQKKLDFLREKKAIVEGDASVLDNPYSNIFINGLVYKCFLDYEKGYIGSESHRDWSYLKKRMEEEDLLKRITDKDFIEFIYKDLKKITRRSYDEFNYIGKFLSLKKASTDTREQNFNIAFSKVLSC